VKNKKILETKILSVQELKKKREDEGFNSSKYVDIFLPPNHRKNHSTTRLDKVERVICEKILYILGIWSC